MKIIKEENGLAVKIFLEDETKKLVISVMGNGDLYWSLNSNDVNEDYRFIIEKSDYKLYKIFEQLYSDIENINIFDSEDIKEDKSSYKKYNCSNYNELFDEYSKTITWYSDETAHEVANFLRIKKGKDSFKVSFYTQPQIEGYDRDFSSLRYIPIRFRNSGSSYEPFNIVFMRMYNNLKSLDALTVNDRPAFSTKSTKKEPLDKEKIEKMKKIYLEDYKSLNGDDQDKKKLILKR